MKKKTKLVGMTFAIKEHPELKSMMIDENIRFVRNTQYDKPDFPEAKGIMVMSGDIRLGWIANKSPEQAEINKLIDESNNSDSGPVCGVVTECDYSSSKPWCEVEYETGESETVPESKSSDDHNFEFYMKDGKQYRRLSNVLKRVQLEDDPTQLEDWKLRTFNSVKEYDAFMDAAANNGTIMHAANQCACDLGIIGSDNQDEIVMKIPKDQFDKIPQGFWKFVATECRGMKILGVEQTVYDDENLIAGTFDLLLKSSDGRVIIVDWKSSKTVRQEQLIKTSWYGHMAVADEAWVVAFGSKNICGYQLKKVTSRNAISVAKEIVDDASKMESSRQLFGKLIKG